MITSYLTMTGNETLGITMTVIIIALFLYYSRNKAKRNRNRKYVNSLIEWAEHE